MKTRILFFLFAAVLAMTGLIQIADRPANAAPVVTSPSANGHGNFRNADGVLRTFSFHARTKDGVTKGYFLVYNRINGHFLKGDIDCMVITGSGVGARMSGTVTDTNVPNEVPVGTQTRFSVADFGEGKDDDGNALPDYVSTFDHSGLPCNNGDLITVNVPVDGGNIQVKP